ncbi:dimethyladenosine transferase (plasmid) [Legionella adelaidensis]|uniref:Ribosomal RNA small subunit methyltransferase A n=1 Tax=Legionella adelaidensis TaxID=45056 RepID=A0A0W0R0S6_9GAMM|nr:16S rRNA (adenine(1518)-N(6)/adenine(1519)-N(6))-dimethyltransferase RsmA [Legionella adelaidensis]KTC64634.1 dimethyladenosine transferase [Legionella adelaidensis]VEH86102.1 dimethyladenosine transferase [Legionella adelaidensis]
MHQPRKRFGQNFLQDKNIINKILRSFNPKPDEFIVEIGPGLGALTLPLLQEVNSLVAIEIDKDLQKYLQAQPEAKNKLKIIDADALTINYSDFGHEIRVIGNLPYNISTPLLFSLLQSSQHIKDMLFMLQKEVVERLAAEPGTKDYGRLSIMVQYLCQVDYLFTVPAEAFFPPPKVESAIVSLTPYKKNPFTAVPVQQLEKLVAKAFSMRRKTLANNLKGFINLDILEKLNINPGLRPEQVTVEQYAQIAKLLAN